MRNCNACPVDFILLLKDACDQINERIRPFKEKDPSAGWNQWVSVKSLSILFYKYHLLGNVCLY